MNKELYKFNLMMVSLYKSIHDKNMLYGDIIETLYNELYKEIKLL